MPIERINPDGMYDPPNDVLSQVVTATGDRQIHVAGTISEDEDGEIVGETIEEQTRKTLENVETSLEAAGATPEDVVRLTIYTVDAETFVADGDPHLRSFFGEETLPAATLIGVDHLARPEFLVELEVTAVVDE
ncbi:RidA family protein [Natrarchaeobius oligotrophus]|uniref:RidA family protein n=1 Tax=Natrarchaeobius chitinivorans TaxID=1679083 RepID=A0A3N6MF79_NATCH|nr:RidA family protein [Natrarchaeobius chitinivorans]RQH02599.1 RidA family protein [Natrarchaeobius chitinivorans]